MIPSLQEIILALTLSAHGGLSVAPEELVCLSRNIYHEARGESLKGQVAVGYVTLNRVSKDAFPDTICGVVYQKGQFSWTKDGKTDLPRDMIAYETAMNTAIAVIRGNVPDPTEGSLYFHAGSNRAFWTRRLERTVKIGGHSFYAEKTQPTSN